MDWIILAQQTGGGELGGAELNGADAAAVTAVIVGYFLCVGFFVLLGIASTAFWIWMLVDCCTKEPSEGNDKIVWILVIVLLQFIGGLIYYFARRPQRIAMYGR